MLRPDGQENAATQLSDMVRHVAYLVERMGIDCVALGSDFDGATIPEESPTRREIRSSLPRWKTPDMVTPNWQKYAGRTG